MHGDDAVAPPGLLVERPPEQVPADGVHVQPHQYAPADALPVVRRHDGREPARSSTPEISRNRSCPWRSKLVSSQGRPLVCSTTNRRRGLAAVTRRSGAGQLAWSLQPMSDPEPRRWNRKLPGRRSSPGQETGKRARERVPLPGTRCRPGNVQGLSGHPLALWLNSLNPNRKARARGGGGLRRGGRNKRKRRERELYPGAGPDRTGPGRWAEKEASRRRAREGWEATRVTT